MAPQMDPQMDIEQEHRNPYPDPDEREPSYPPTPDERAPYANAEGRSSYPDPEQPETPSGVFRVSLSQHPELIGTNRKQRLAGPLKEYEKARANMATNVSRRKTAIRATQQYQDATDEHKRSLLADARNQIEAEFREQGKHPEQIAARLGVAMPLKGRPGRPSLSEARGRPRKLRPPPESIPQQNSDAMAVDDQINRESQAGGEEDGHQQEESFSPARPVVKKGRAERIADLEQKLRVNESRMRDLERALENERAKTAKFETRLARIEVVFNPRLLRTNEATLASLEQRNVMANGAAFNP